MSKADSQNKDYIMTSVFNLKGLGTECLISAFKVKFMELLNLTGLSPVLATILAFQVLVCFISCLLIGR